MAALTAGVQYSLTSQGHLNDNKSLIFVKLTDSAIRAIEEHIRNKNKLGQCPTIQFQGNEGLLRFPSLNQSNNGVIGSRSLNGGSSGKTGGVFKFSLNSSCDIEGPQGSFECIKYAAGQRCVERVGQMPCIMRVQANEDVYEVTKNRMAAVEKQHKENCTREIELDKSAGIGRRVKVRPKPVSGGGPIKRKEPPPQPAITAPYSAPPKSHTRPQGNNHAQKPGNPEICKRSVRDRVIHLLAVRPYKKPEIYLALNKDGLKDKDKSNLNNTLLSVAACKDNTYHLLRHIWNEVQDDWPFFSDLDKHIMKKRRPQNLTPPGSSDGGSGGSPESPGSQSPVGTVKRPGYYDGADGLPTKKPRISHYHQNSGPMTGSRSISTGLLPTPTTTPTHAPASPQPAPTIKLPHPSPPTPPQDKTPPKPDYPPPPHHNKPIQECPKYLLDYTTIKDINQRRKYKEDFNANYNEYKKLHSMVENVTKKFSELDEKLRREEKGSPSWQRIKDQILMEYHVSKKNPHHQDAKRRFHYLHDKLSHIKRLVMEYDAKVT